MKIKDVDQTKKIFLYGENHTVSDEVENIREKIIKLNPDVIVHELYWEDKEFYNKVLPNTDVIPLEDEVKNNDDLILQFKNREDSMIDHLNSVIDKDYNVIAVVVGDTHLRTIKTKELGDVSPLVKWATDNNAQIIRSSHKEIE